MAPGTEAAPAADLPGKLKWYYARLFPLQPFIRWLRYGSDENLARREISFTLAGDIYLRWKSFTSGEELLDALKSLAPVKMDIGAIYNHPPADKHSMNAVLTPKQKELVFDIDMTDYEEVIGDLGGGTPTEVTDRNWRYMATAVTVLDTALREDFGFEHLLWVYSGRRGIHCWVGDQRARLLTNEQRIGVAEYLHLRVEGRENAGRRQSAVTAPLHPALARAKRVACEETFRDFVLGEQGMLHSPERVADMCDLIPLKSVAVDVRAKLDRMGVGRGVEKWERFEKELAKAGRTDWGLRAVADYVLLRCTYPRLDVNVSREISHLLKAPFCVHPKTGRVCVPFRAGEAAAFAPQAMAPTLDGLLAEVNAGGGGPLGARLDEAVTVLEEFVRGVEGEARDAARTARLAEMDRRGAVELVG